MERLETNKNLSLLATKAELTNLGERNLHDLDAAMGKVEATLKPILQYVASRQGQSEGVGISARFFVAALGVAVTIITVIILLITFYKGS
jgi:hypothetical protein